MSTLPADPCQNVAYSRKSKSLSILCTNFMGLYNRDDVEAIGLDDAAKKLGVERRRIYDIVNVLESVGVLARKGKNQYNWIGYQGIPKALQNLQNEPLYDIYVHHSREPYLKSSQEEEEESGESEKSSLFFDSSISLNTRAKPALDQRREKSLGLLTQNFVRLFLTTNHYPVTLDEAAKVLLGDGHDSVNMRTKVRRLYDIANVLQAMNLIEKTQQPDTKKPGYRWLGLEGPKLKPDPLTTKPSTSAPPVLSIDIQKQARLKRSFGTELTNLESSKRQKLDPFMETRPVSAHESNGFCFGPFQPVKRESFESVDKERVKKWESMADGFRPQYHNQALSDLFGHYVEAWRSWYRQFAQGNNNNNGMSF